MFNKKKNKNTQQKHTLYDPLTVSGGMGPPSMQQMIRKNEEGKNNKNKPRYDQGKI